MANLTSKYSITFKAIDGTNTDLSKDAYEKDIKEIATLESIENVMYFLSHLKDFEKIERQFYINVFKEGIEPVWEDENNRNGCNWSLMLKKEVCQRYFERLLINLTTDFFKTFEATGIVGIAKDNRFKLSIWSKTVPTVEQYANVIEELKQALEIDFQVSFHYKNHIKLLELQNKQEEEDK